MRKTVSSVNKRSPVQDKTERRWGGWESAPIGEMSQMIWITENSNHPAYAGYR